MRILGTGLVIVLLMPRDQAAPPAVRGPAADTTIAIQTFRFRPTSLVVSAGTRVTWANGDEIEHTVTAGLPDSATGGFSGRMKAQGATFTHTFTRTGTFTYYCERHHFMRGEIRVTSTGEK
jgi:plastocyanin